MLVHDRTSTSGGTDMGMETHVAAMASAGAQRPRVQSDRRHRDLNVARKRYQKKTKRLPGTQPRPRRTTVEMEEGRGAKPAKAPRRNNAIISHLLPAQTSRRWPNPFGLVHAGRAPHTPSVGGTSESPLGNGHLSDRCSSRLRRRKVAALSRCGMAVLCGAPAPARDTSAAAPTCGVGLRCYPNRRVLLPE